MNNNVEDHSKTVSGSHDILEILLIGEHLRVRVHTETNLVGNKKYHLRTYSSCFVGKDMVTWLINSGECLSRDSAVLAMNILLDKHVIHHVCDDHEFFDKMLFYRFRVDDDTVNKVKETELFAKGLKLHKEIMSKRSGILRDYEEDDQRHCDSFMGSDLVDWLIENGQVYSREEGIKKCREFLEADIIKHVTDDYHFRDTRLLYQFTLDFEKKCRVSDIYRYQGRNRNLLRSTSKTERQKKFPDDTDKASLTESTNSYPNLTDTSLPNDIHARLHFPTVAPSESISSGNTERRLSMDTETDSEIIPRPPSVLIRHASVAELEDPDTPYIKKSVRITSDSVGYGFVIRGTSPTYVQTIDPLGPAVSAGLKVRQYIYSVNGENVLRMDHKVVAKKIMSTISNQVVLEVMRHKRDASFE